MEEIARAVSTATPAWTWQERVRSDRRHRRTDDLINAEAALAAMLQ